MRVCAVTTSFAGFGGIQTVIARTVEHLPQHCWEVRAVHMGANHAKEAYPELMSVPMRGVRQRFLPRRLPDRLSTVERQILLEAAHFGTARIEADVIVAHYPLSNLVSLRHANVVWYAHCALRFLHEPALAAEFGSPSWLTRKLRDYILRLEKEAVLRAARVCCNSERTRQKLHEYFGIDAQVIYMGCDLERARCEAYEPYFIYPTRLQRYKRVDLAIEAMKLVPEAGLKIIGTGYDAPRLRALAAGCPNITLVDRVDDLYDEYARCLGVIFPPYDEDFGLVPVEAMSCAKPVVAVDEGGPRETIIDGETGFLVPATPDAIADKARLLASDRHLAREMGRKGKDRAQQFSWNRFAREFGEVLHRAADSR
jgi:glycosyltransferase involved in cell wall biosynthesis